jgi:molecular chaperone DnaK (HSP70)
MSEAKYLVGIDLGTSNCAMAFVDLAQGVDAYVRDFPVPQLARPGETAPRPLLPSCLYLPGQQELAPEAIRTPWDSHEDANQSPVIVGEFARWQGARVPGRFVASAKSWLCHPGVDRSAPILPWGASPDVAKISPVKASELLLRHMVQAWNYEHPGALIANQEVVITVPASFDEAARSLTVTAARQAGLEKFTLVEEPQAAFYDFTARHRRKLAEALEGMRLVLVVDVGGGTSDFTLVQVGASAEGPLMRRIAVGEHLILGGDNMDASLSRRAEERLGSRKLSATQWNQLLQAARQAKETLLSDAAAEQFNLSIVSEGSRLIGGSISTHLTRTEAVQLVLDGFFPPCSATDTPQRTARVALQELGLPYAQDPAITRHLAAFLRTHAEAGLAALGMAESDPGFRSPLPRPDAILLNGGVFNSRQIAERLVQVVSNWWPEQPPIAMLEHSSLELAVARGAAYYGLVRRGMGRRISGGAAHALFIGMEKIGSQQPMALCVIPRGREEGESVLMDRVFSLTIGKPVQFPLYSTSSDRVEKAGEVVPVSEDMRPLPAIHTLLKKSGGGKFDAWPVQLRATLTEIGTLELFLVSKQSEEQWRLEFELRDAAAQPTESVTESMPPRFGEAREWIERIFGSKPSAAATPASSAPKDVKQLWASLERTLGTRAEWRVPVLRELWGALFAGASRRRRSADHERIFLQLAGYTLRPGFGYPLDDWRCEQIFKLFGESVQFHKEKPIWTEFWVMWRRIAGGLVDARQQEIWAFLKPHLANRIPPNAPKNIAKPKGVQPEGLEEMVRLGASLEHLEPADKAELGQWIIERLGQPGVTGGAWAWSLGRLGSRVPIYGSSHKVVAPAKAKEWLSFLIEHGGMLEGAPFAIAQIARLAGDRSRDLDDSTRSRVAEFLEKTKAPAPWIQMVREVLKLESADEARALGDTLPVGLKTH